MRSAVFMSLALLLVSAGAVEAQSPSEPRPRIYAEATVGGTFGYKADAMFGGELGYRLTERIGFFAEGVYLRNFPTADLADSAATIVQYLNRFGTAGSEVKQPVSHFDAGAWYEFSNGSVRPYATVGVGAAKVTKRVSFTVNNVDVTGQLLETYGVQLGADLTGSETAALITAGAGLRFNIRGPLIGDASYRYGHAFLSDEGLNTHRLQIGVGVQF